MMKSCSPENGKYECIICAAVVRGLRGKVETMLSCKALPFLSFSFLRRVGDGLGLSDVDAACRTH